MNRIRRILPRIERFLLFAIAILAAIAVPADASSIEILDPAGDARLNGAPAGPVLSGLDILRFNATESVDTIDVDLVVAALRGSDPMMRWTVPVTWQDDRWELRLEKGNVDGAQRAYRGWLRWIDSGGLPMEIRELDVHVDEAQGVLRTRIPRQYLAGIAGAEPTAGDALRLGPVVAALIGADEASDQAPDDGIATPLLLDLNEIRVGAVTIRAHPMGRFSNGEAAIHEYELLLENQGDTTQVDLRITSARGTDAAVGLRQVPLEHAQIRSVPAWILMPFQHQHGANVDAIVSASVGGGRAELPLRVRFVEHPQPTGHHPEIWLHAFPEAEQETGIAGAQTAFWSTLDDDPRSGAQPIHANRAGGGVNGADGPLTSTITWDYRYSPDLRLDIDPRRAEPGHVTLTLTTQVPLQDASVSAIATIRDEAGGMDAAMTEPIALLLPVRFGDLAAGQSVLVDQTLDRVVPGRLVPARPGFNLWVEINLHSQPNPILGPAAPPPLFSIAPGARLELPLREVRQAEPPTPFGGFDSAPPIILWPGGTSRIDVDITPPSSRLQLHAVGPQADWIGLPSTIEAGSSRLTFSVRTPNDSPVGSTFTAAVVATPEDPGGATGFLPLLATVAAGTSSGAMEKPGPGVDEPNHATPSPWALVLFSLASVAWRRNLLPPR